MTVISDETQSICAAQNGFATQESALALAGSCSIEPRTLEKLRRDRVRRLNGCNVMESRLNFQSVSSAISKRPCDRHRLSEHLPGLQNPVSKQS